MTFSEQALLEVPLDWKPLLLAFIVNFHSISPWWYAVFSKQWLGSIRQSYDQIKQGKSMGQCMLIEGISRFLFTFGFYYIIYLFNLQSLTELLIMASWLAIAYVILPFLQPVLWEGNQASYIIFSALERVLSLYLTALFFYWWNPNILLHVNSHDETAIQESRQQCELGNDNSEKCEVASN